MGRQQAAAQHWSANVNLNLDGPTRRNLSNAHPIAGVGAGPAYSIPSQPYPGRFSPDKTERDRTPRTPIRANSSSPQRQTNDLTIRSVSPMPTSEQGDVTPGCTDYTPRRE